MELVLLSEANYFLKKEEKKIYLLSLLFVFYYLIYKWMQMNLNDETMTLMI